MEYRRGILFVRLNGKLTKETISSLKQTVSQLITENGIRNVVFNIDGLIEIDLYGIQELLSNCYVAKQNQGRALLCGMKNTRVRRRIENSRLLKYMYETSDELSAIYDMNF